MTLITQFVFKQKFLLFFFRFALEISTIYKSMWSTIIRAIFRDWGCGPSLSGGENSRVFPVLGKIINPFFQIIGNTDVIIILIKTSKENFYSSLYSKMTFPW
jgi:hypothetical protein